MKNDFLSSFGELLTRFATCVKKQDYLSEKEKHVVIKACIKNWETAKELRGEELRKFVEKELTDMQTLKTYLKQKESLRYNGNVIKSDFDAFNLDEYRTNFNRHFWMTYLSSFISTEKEFNKANQTIGNYNQKISQLGVRQTIYPPQKYRGQYNYQAVRDVFKSFFKGAGINLLGLIATGIVGVEIFIVGTLLFTTIATSIKVVKAIISHVKQKKPEKEYNRKLNQYYSDLLYDDNQRVMWELGEKSRLENESLEWQNYANNLKYNLDSMWNMNVVRNQYLNTQAMNSIYELFLAGKTSSLEPTENDKGAYRLYEEALALENAQNMYPNNMATFQGFARELKNQQVSQINQWNY